MFESEPKNLLSKSSDLFRTYSQLQDLTSDCMSVGLAVLPVISKESRGALYNIKKFRSTARDIKESLDCFCGTPAKCISHRHL